MKNLLIFVYHFIKVNLIYSNLFKDSLEFNVENLAYNCYKIGAFERQESVGTQGQLVTILENRFVW